MGTEARQRYFDVLGDAFADGGGSVLLLSVSRFWEDGQEKSLGVILVEELFGPIFRRDGVVLGLDLRDEYRKVRASFVSQLRPHLTSRELAHFLQTTENVELVTYPHGEADAPVCFRRLLGKVEAVVMPSSRGSGLDDESVHTIFLNLSTLSSPDADAFKEGVREHIIKRARLDGRKVDEDAIMLGALRYRFVSSAIAHELAHLLRMDIFDSWSKFGECQVGDNEVEEFGRKVIHTARTGCTLSRDYVRRFLGKPLVVEQLP